MFFFLKYSFLLERKPTKQHFKVKSFKISEFSPQEKYFVILSGVRVLFLKNNYFQNSGCTYRAHSEPSITEELYDEAAHEATDKSVNELQVEAYK